MNVLVVDDEVFICDLLDEFLSKLGYGVTTATNGIEALKRFSERKFEVVLMDLKMPGMGGRELLNKIKGIDSSTSVIVLSAFGDGITVNEILQIGAADFLVKPFELDHLEELLNSRNQLYCEGKQ